MTGREAPTAVEVARLEAEWRRLEQEHKPGRLRAYQRWQAAEDQMREARRPTPTQESPPMTAPDPTASTPLVAKVGRLTRDPELRYGKSGTAVATFGLAVKPYTPKGAPEADVSFYETLSFGGLAEHVAECLTKGDRVVVTGRGEVERWTGKDGVERTTKKILADAIGPDLRFAGADIHRADRREPVSPEPDDEEPF